MHQSLPLYDATVTSGGEQNVRGPHLLVEVDQQPQGPQQAPPLKPHMSSTYRPMSTSAEPYVQRRSETSCDMELLCRADLDLTRRMLWSRSGTMTGSQELLQDSRLQTLISSVELNSLCQYRRQCRTAVDDVSVLAPDTRRSFFFDRAVQRSREARSYCQS